MSTSAFWNFRGGPDRTNQAAEEILPPLRLGQTFYYGKIGIPCVAHDLILVPGYDVPTIAYDLRTYERRWSVPGPSVGEGATDGRLFYCADSALDGEYDIHAMDPGSGDLVWSHRRGQIAVGDSNPFICGGHWLAGGGREAGPENYYFTSFSLSTQQMAWAIQGVESQHAVVSRGILVANTYEPRQLGLLALRVSDGSILWEQGPGNAPSIYCFGVYEDVVVSSNFNRFVGYDLYTGDLRWTSSHEGFYLRTPLAFHGPLFYVIDRDGLYGYDSRNGELIFARDLRDQLKRKRINTNYQYGGLLVTDGYVYFDTEGGWVCCIDRTSGDLVWHMRVPCPPKGYAAFGTYLAAPFVFGGRMFLCMPFHAGFFVLEPDPESKRRKVKSGIH